MTTCLTLTFPGLLLASASCSARGENVALHGVALSGVAVYGDGNVCALPMAGEKGDCGMRSRGVRAERGPGLANGDGGMIIRGDSGLVLLVFVTLVVEYDRVDRVLCSVVSDAVLVVVVVES